MKAHFLATIEAIAEHGTFAAAGNALGLSPSAVSLRIKALEQEIGVTLIDRRGRPATLTPEGRLLCTYSGRLREILRDIDSIGRADHVRGQLVIGAVPTTLSFLLPPTLARLRRVHRELELQVRSGLSGELAASLRQGEIDVALTTEPSLPLDGMVGRHVANEPLVLIAPAQLPRASWRQTLSSQRYIWFSRKTWAGQQIERLIAEARITVRAQMEVDSIEAITAMVRQGLGVAVVPKRVGEPDPLDGLSTQPFGDPPASRRLILLERSPGHKSHLVDILHQQLVKSSGAGIGEAAR